MSVGVLALWHLEPHLPPLHGNSGVENPEGKDGRLGLVLPDPLPLWFVALQ